MDSTGGRSEIAFFDLETTFRTRPGQDIAILEFGSILVDPRKLLELEGYSYSTLVRPNDLSLIPNRSNGINRNAIVSAPTFSEIADRVYHILHGRVWAGHNIVRHDIPRLREAFAQINRPAPEPIDVIDSYVLLTRSFGTRAGDMKMASLATYFGLGQQIHRSLDDVRLNLEVLKHCATVSFLESSLPDIFTIFLEPEDVSIPSITALVPLYSESRKIQILHKDIELQIRCDHLKVRFGINTRFLDNAGRPRLNFVVDASPNLCEVLDACDDLAERCMNSDGNSKWWPVVSRRPGFYDSPTIRLNLPMVGEGDNATWMTEIYLKESSSHTQRLIFSSNEVAELDGVFSPGTFVDAYFSLDPYDYQQNAGTRLVAKKLILHSGN